MRHSKTEETVFAMVAGSAMLAVGTAFVLPLYQAMAMVPPLVDSILLRSVTAVRGFNSDGGVR